MNWTIAFGSRHACHSAFVTPLSCLRFTEKQIDHPTASDMEPRPSAVFDHRGVCTSRLLQNVTEPRHPVEGLLLVDELGKLDSFWRLAGGDGFRSKRIADY